jgi:peptidyl-prolyl cis-trans isomerase A (cyclophilin A)
VADTIHATIETNHGDIRIALFPDQAPKTVDNFVGLAEGKTEWADPTTGEKTKGSPSTGSSPAS